MIKIFKKIKYGIKSSLARYKRTGRCKACGRCCRSIRLVFEGENIKSAEQFEEGKKYNRYFNMFYPSGVRPDGTMKFTCYHLGSDNRCRRYYFRPLKCWTWPDHSWEYIKNGGQTKEGCGFHYEPSVSFDKVLNGIK